MWDCNAEASLCKPWLALLSFIVGFLPGIPVGHILGKDVRLKEERNERGPKH
jgi:hypothetical protein